jgi:hypothetical protein
VNRVQNQGSLLKVVSLSFNLYRSLRGGQHRQDIDHHPNSPVKAANVDLWMAIQTTEV